MIDKIIAYPLIIRDSIFHQPFQAHMRTGAYIPTHKRSSLSPHCESSFDQLKEIFFELFPKLDPEYRKLHKKNKPLRIPVEFVISENVSGFKVGGPYVKEYTNPNAHKIYEKLQIAQKENNIHEIVRLSRELGDYQLIDVSLDAKIMRFIDKILP